MAERRASGGDDRAGDGLFFLLLAPLLLTFSIVNTFSVVHDRAELGERLAFWRPLVWELSSIVVLLVMAPAFLAFFRRVWPLDPPWVRTVGLHLAALVAFSLLHVVGMGVVRWAAYAAVGEHYAPLDPLGDFLYEFRKDALVYVGFVALYVVWRLLRAQRGPAVAAGPGTIEVRDGALRRFVPLTEVAWIEAAGNYVELHHGPTPILHRAPLSQMERQLQGEGFIRIHRSRLVRRAAIAQVESKPSGDYVIRLADGRELAGSRRYRRPLLEP